MRSERDSRSEGAAGEPAVGPAAGQAATTGERGRYATYRWSLFSAGVLNVLGAAFASLPKDTGVALRRLAILSVWFWALTAIYVAARRTPTLAERVTLGAFPFLLLLWAISR